MRCLVVSRPVTNGGDYLIAEKLQKLVEHEFPNDEIVYRCGTGQFDKEFIASFDGIIIGGGPLYDNKFFEKDAFPLWESVIESNISTTIIGAGWYGSSNSNEEIYSYKLSEEALKVLTIITNRGGYLGCRDNITARVLKNNNLTNVLITGCPVWFDFDILGKEFSKINSNFMKIAISDPGITKKKNEQEIKSDQAISVIKIIRDKFPDSEIIFTFNNGIETKYSTPCNMKIKEHLESQKIDYYDLSKSSDGFRLYDDIDFHVGYRVHSHIYTLSKMKPSILIEEDARGYGTNQVLGLGENLTAYEPYAMKNNILIANPYLLKMIDDSIDEMIESNYIRILNAFHMIRETYKSSIRKIFMKFPNTY